MRKICSILLSFILMTTMMVSAVSLADGEILEMGKNDITQTGNAQTDMLIDESTQTLIKYTGTHAEPVIPEGIKIIGSRAFENSVIERILIPDSVIAIGDAAFRYCSALKEVHLSANLKTIGDYAFLDCHMLDQLVLPEGISYIGNYAFSWNNTCDDKTGCEYIQIPASVVQIATNQQSYSGWATGISCPHFDVVSDNPIYRVENGMLIGQGVLLDYYEPTDENPFRIVTVPNDVTYIAPCAFSNTHVLSVKLPETLQKIGQAAFWGCMYLMELTIDFETTEVQEGIVFFCGLSEYTSGIEWEADAKSALKNIYYYDETDSEPKYYEPISEEVLNELPDQPTLTINNIDQAQSAIHPYTDDPLMYITGFGDDYCYLYMDIKCDP